MMMEICDGDFFCNAVSRALQTDPENKRVGLSPGAELVDAFIGRGGGIVGRWSRVKKWWNGALGALAHIRSLVIVGFI